MVNTRLPLTSLDLFSAITAEEHRTVNTRRVLIVATETENYSAGGGVGRSDWSDVLWSQARQKFITDQTDPDYREISSPPM